MSVYGRMFVRAGGRVLPICCCRSDVEFSTKWRVFAPPAMIWATEEDFLAMCKDPSGPLQYWAFLRNGKCPDAEAVCRFYLSGLKKIVTVEELYTQTDTSVVVRGPKTLSTCVTSKQVVQAMDALGGDLEDVSVFFSGFRANDRLRVYRDADYGPCVVAERGRRNGVGYLVDYNKEKRSFTFSVCMEKAIRFKSPSEALALFKNYGSLDVYPISLAEVEERPEWTVMFALRTPNGKHISQLTRTRLMGVSDPANAKLFDSPWSADQWVRDVLAKRAFANGMDPRKDIVIVPVTIKNQK